jgi:phosphoglycolate phosphatase
MKLLVGETIFLDNPQLIMLDKDGTLIDIHHYWASMIRLRAEKIGEKWFYHSQERNLMENLLIDAMGVDLITGKMKSEGPVGVKPRWFIVKVAIDVINTKGISVSDSEMEMLFQEVDEATAQDMLPLLRLLPGVKKFLKNASHHNIDLSVVSTDITSRTRKAMTVLKIDNYFQSIIGGDAVQNTKPAADLAEIALRNDNYSREKVVVIGDHPVDIRMGLNAGIQNNIGILTGLSSREMFEPYRCVIAQNFESIEIRS